MSPVFGGDQRTPLQDTPVPEFVGLGRRVLAVEEYI